jgi:hypothetical protein
MNSTESQAVLLRSLPNKLLSCIQLLSEHDIDIYASDAVLKPFLESQWEIRDFELLLDLTGNLDAPR